MAQRLHYILVEIYFMESAQKKDGHNAQNLNDGYNSADRDHQRTEKKVDNFSQPAKEELEKRKERTKRANTRPGKKKIN
jgi:hypothetical protein